MNSTRDIQGTISEKLLKIGSNGRDYLILKLRQGEDIFVFDNKDTPKDNWHQLSEYEEYVFNVKEGNRIGSNVLVYFEKLII